MAKQTYTQPKVVYSQPTYNLPKVTYAQPSYSQPKVTYTQPSYSQKNPVKIVSPPSYNPNTIVSSYKPAQTVTVADSEEEAEGDYSAYPYPYQQSSYKQVASVVDTEETEETEVAPVDEVKEEARSAKVVTEEEKEVSDDSNTNYDTLFRKFKSYNLDDDSKQEEEREGKTIDTDADILNPNSIDSVASTTLLPEFVPIVFEEDGISPVTEGITVPQLEITTKPDNPTTTTATTVTSTSSSIRRRPVTSFFHDSVTTTPRPTTPSIDTASSSSIRRRPVISVFHQSLSRTTTIKPTTTTTKVTTTTPVPTTTISTTVLLDKTSSSVRRRPVVSFFHDLTTSTAAPAPELVTPPGEIGQTILDKMRTATLTVENILESDEEITLRPDDHINEESIDEGNSRERRKVLKVRKPKPSMHGF